MDHNNSQKKAGTTKGQTSFWPQWRLEVLPVREEGNRKMANVATARALFGLGNDLNDKELLQLTRSETRPALKLFLSNPLAFLEYHKVANGQQAEEPPMPEFPKLTVTPYAIHIRHRENFAKRLKALACNWVHPWITEENTPVKVNKAKGAEKKEVFVIHFDRDMKSSEEVVEAMAALGYKPADHEDLLAFGTDHPDVQREFPVIQLGSSWERPGYGRVVSYLYRHDSVRDLCLYVWHDKWSALFRFLAVRAA